MDYICKKVDSKHKAEGKRETVPADACLETSSAQ